MGTTSERFGQFLMNKKGLLLLWILIVAACVFLFNVFYFEAKKNAIRKLNEQQLIHARQAAHGIEEFFTTWTGILNSSAEIAEIINTGAEGKRLLDLFYEAHRKQIRSVTRVDENGTIRYTAPYTESIGSDISDQTHMREILRNHQPVISDVFRSVQGFDAIALHVPVFKGPRFSGTLAIVLNFQELSKRYLEVIKIGRTGHARVVSRDGIELYSPFPEHIGKSVFENHKEFPSVLNMTTEMLAGNEGSAIYTWYGTGEGTSVPVTHHAVYMPIRMGNTFWSIVVASSEAEVLSSLASFRNRLLLMTAVMLLFGVVFSAFFVKAWLIVTEEGKRKHIEAELRASEQRYRNLFEKNPAPMLIYQRGTLKLLAVNEAFVHDYGYTREEASRLLLTDLYPEAEKVPVSEVAASLKGHAYAGEWHHLKADGSVIDIDARSHDIDYWGHEARIAVISDITERKRTENALRSSEEKFFKAFHATPDAITISRASDGLLLEVNEVFQQVTGYSRDEALHRTTAALNLWVDLHDRDRYTAEILEKGRMREMEARFRTKSGRILDGLVSGEGILLGDIPCKLTIIRDITERKRTDAELQKHRLHLEDLVNERTEELKAANEKLMELDRLKSMFIASMSHELRTPLNSIIGFTGILLQGLAGPLNDEQRKQLGMVKGSSRHLLDLITDIIDISKIEAGKISLSLESFDLAAIANEILDTLRPEAGRKSLQFDISAPKQLIIESDRRRVKQVLVNLMGNALKFTPKGKVSVMVKEESGIASVAVHDTGPGIRREDMEKLFLYFSQITSTDTPTHEGTGLGLYLSKKLANLLGGDIRAESEVGKGSVFTMTLPLTCLGKK